MNYFMNIIAVTVITFVFAHVTSGTMSLLQRHAIKRFKPVEPQTYLFNKTKDEYFKKFKLQGDVELLDG